MVETVHIDIAHVRLRWCAFDRARRQFAFARRRTGASHRVSQPGCSEREANPCMVGLIPPPGWAPTATPLVASEPNRSHLSETDPSSLFVTHQESGGADGTRTRGLLRDRQSGSKSKCLLWCRLRIPQAGMHARYAGRAL